jgi:hypothetical protein
LLLSREVVYLITILSLYILYKLELALYNLRILVESSLIVILAIEFNLKLRVTFNKVYSLVLANRITITLS